MTFSNAAAPGLCRCPHFGNASDPTSGLHGPPVIQSAAGSCIRVSVWLLCGLRQGHSLVKAALGPTRAARLAAYGTANLVVPSSPGAKQHITKP